MLVADRLHDHRRVRGQRAGVVADEQRAAVGRDVLDALGLDPEPVAVVEVEQRVGEPDEALGAAPVVERRARRRPRAAGRALLERRLAVRLVLRRHGRRVGRELVGARVVARLGRRRLLGAAPGSAASPRAAGCRPRTSARRARAAGVAAVRSAAISLERDLDEPRPSAPASPTSTSRRARPRGAGSRARSGRGRGRGQRCRSVPSSRSPSLTASPASAGAESREAPQVAVRLALVVKPGDGLLADVAALGEADGALVDPGLLGHRLGRHLGSEARAAGLDPSDLGGLDGDLGRARAGERVARGAGVRGGQRSGRSPSRWRPRAHCAADRDRARASARGPARCRSRPRVAGPITREDRPGLARRPRSRRRGRSCTSRDGGRPRAGDRLGVDPEAVRRRAAAPACRPASAPCGRAARRSSPRRARAPRRRWSAGPAGTRRPRRPETVELAALGAVDEPRLLAQQPVLAVQLDRRSAVGSAHSRSSVYLDASKTMSSQDKNKRRTCEKKGLSRRRLIGGAAAARRALPVLHEVDPAPGAPQRARRRADARAPRRRRRRPRRMAHTHGGGASGPTFRKGEAVDHAANGFNPTEILRDFDYGKTTQLAERPHPARVDARRRGQGDRDRARRQVPGLDLQRPGPGPDAALHRGRPAADPVRQRLGAPAHDPLPRAPPGRHGRRARDRRRHDRAGRARSTSSSAEPFGLHLYHCHVGPLAEHIARGLYGDVHHRSRRRAAPRPTRC